MRQLVRTKEDILTLLRENGPRLQALGVRRLGLFGSFVRGEQTPVSDVDLLVEFEPQKKSFDNFMALSFLLEDLLVRKVELVTTESLSAHIGPNILKEAEYVSVAA